MAESKSDPRHLTSRIGFVCSIAFDYELGECETTIYPSLEDLEEDHPPAKDHPGGCGVYKVKIEVIEEVHKKRYMEREP